MSSDSYSDSDSENSRMKHNKIDVDQLEKACLKVCSNRYLAFSDGEYYVTDDEGKAQLRGCRIKGDYPIFLIDPPAADYYDIVSFGPQVYYTDFLWSAGDRNVMDMIESEWGYDDASEKVYPHDLYSAPYVVQYPKSKPKEAHSGDADNKRMRIQ